MSAETSKNYSVLGNAVAWGLALTWANILTNGAVWETTKNVAWNAMDIVSWVATNGLNAIQVNGLPHLGPWAPLSLAAVWVYKWLKEMGNRFSKWEIFGGLWGWAEKWALWFGAPATIASTVGLISAPIAPAILAGDLGLYGLPKVAKAIQWSVSNISKGVASAWTGLINKLNPFSGSLRQATA